MERTSNCCTLASLVALVILLLFPVRSWCKEVTNKSMTEVKPECCVNKDADSKRLDDIDYDSFVSLMGRRALQPNSHRNTPMSRKKRIDQILAERLGRRTRMACPCAEEYLRTRTDQFINQWMQRFQRFL